MPRHASKRPYSLLHNLLTKLRSAVPQASVVEQEVNEEYPQLTEPMWVMPSTPPRLPQLGRSPQSIAADEELWEALTGEFCDSPAPAPSEDSAWLGLAASLPTVPAPSLSSNDDGDELHTALLHLRNDLVWTVSQAEQFFGPLATLERAELIHVAASAMGRIVSLGREGRRRVQAKATYRSFSVEPLENILYFRLAAQRYGWEVESEPPVYDRRRRGYLDQLGYVREHGELRLVMARVTAGGYDRRTVTKRFNFLRGTLLSRSAVLLVITPDLAKVGRMHGRRGLLEIREFKIR